MTGYGTITGAFVASVVFIVFVSGTGAVSTFLYANHYATIQSRCSLTTGVVTEIYFCGSTCAIMISFCIAASLAYSSPSSLTDF